MMFLARAGKSSMCGAAPMLDSARNSDPSAMRPSAMPPAPRKTRRFNLSKGFTPLLPGNEFVGVHEHTAHRSPRSHFRTAQFLRRLGARPVFVKLRGHELTEAFTLDGV